METTSLQPAITDFIRSTATVLDVVREGTATTRPEICRRTGLARNLVADRVEQLLSVGLIAEGELGRSTGGRAPRSLRFRADAGRILVAELGATLVNVGITDLSGTLMASTERAIDVTAGPEVTLDYLSELMGALLGENPGADTWGIGIGLPGPVEWGSGRPVAPPIMPGWDGFDVRRFFNERYHRPVWVDNDVNVMATGEVRAGVARGHESAIYIKVGTGIGAGLVSRGKLHRGAQGAAGDIGHMAVAGSSSQVLCRCGNSGCLEALAGGAALAREAVAAADNPRSTYLRQLRRDGQELTSASVIEAARHADPVAMELLTASAALVGDALAGMVNLLNPSIIVLGGSVGRSLDLYLATVRRAVLNRSLPLATRSLQIVTSPLGDKAGLIGAAYTVLDELFSPAILATWIGMGRPGELRQMTA
mgnify:CR=1 FL=1